MSIVIADIYSSCVSAQSMGKSRIEFLESINKEIKNYIITSPCKNAEELKEEEFKILVCEMNHSSTNPINDSKAVKRLQRVIRDLKPDIVHTHNSKGGAIGRIAANKENVPFVIHQVHGYYFKRFAGVKETIFRNAEKLLSRYCDLLLFQNLEDLSLSKKMGIPESKLLYINNGIDFSDFTFSKLKNTPKEDKILNIVCVARMDKNKNHEMIFNALELIGDKIPYKVYLIGKGALSNTHKARVENSKLKDKVEFCGFVERKDISNITSKCHLNVLTSKQEGKPRTAMEASYMGIPTVATDIDGTREVVIPGKTGELVEYNDYKALADKIIEFYKDESKWKKISKSCHDYALNNFDEKIVVERLNKIYKAVMDNSIDELVKKTDNGKNWENI